MSIREKIIRLAHANPDIRSYLLPLLKEATTNKEEWAPLFDALRPNQTVSLAMISVMGMAKVFDGGYHEWVVYQKGKAQGQDVITLFHPDGSKPMPQAAVRLWKRPSRDGSKFTVSASHGNMALILKGMRV